MSIILDRSEEKSLSYPWPSVLQLTCGQIAEQAS